MSIVTLLQAAQNGAGPNSFMSVVPLVLIFVIFYFFIIRPQSKRQKETEKMINAVKKGDKIVTVGGIHGTVATAKEKTVIVKVDEGVKIEFNRSAIASVIGDKPAENKNDKKAKSEEKQPEETPSESSSENAENK